jgi:ATP-binding cassette, subfamily B, bacterial CvaB/MchF/RaxB
MKNVLELIRFSSKRRLPIILQTEIAECALACLAMVSSYHGYEVDLNTLRRTHPITLRGTNLQTLMQVSEKMGFAGRPLRLELDEMDQLQTPTILHWDMNHFVVLKKATKKQIIIHDPAQGLRTFTIEEASKHFTGIALELTPTSEFKPKKEVKKISFNSFWEKITGLKPAMIQVFVLSIVLQLFSLISPLFVQLVVDEVVLRKDTHLLLILALGFFMVMLIDVLTSALRSYVVMRFSSLLSIQMATNLFRHLIRLPLSYFEKRHIGDILSRFGSLGQIKEFLTTGIVQVVVDGIMAITTLFMLFLYGSSLAWIVILAVTIYGMIRLAWYRPLKALTEESIITGAKESSNFMETIRGIQSIKIFGKESQRQVMWQNRYADTMNTGIRLGKLNIAFSSINSLLFGIENIVIIYIAATMILNNQFSVGMLFAFTSYKSNFTSKAVALIEKGIEIKMLGLHLERLGDIALEPQEVQGAESTDFAPILKGDVELQNISYRYSENDPWVLNKANLKIKSGESVAIVGPSGCGKTTMMKVMMGLFTANDGKVLIDGQELKRIGLKTFREQVAGVMQDDQLLSGSIADNISFFDPQPDMEKIIRCAEMAVIAPDIAFMPMAYNTLIGDMGTTLSGGQKQRVLLARALYKEPAILFLDEATSHLDIALEQAVNHAIQTLKVTRIIIAHRPETIRSADRVVVLTPEGLFEQPKQTMAMNETETV